MKRQPSGLGWAIDNILFNELPDRGYNPGIMTSGNLGAVRFRGFPAALLIAALGVVVGAQAPPAPSQEADVADPSPIFRSGVTLVTTDVIVRDGDGVFTADLTENDFRVWEDDIEQEVASLVLVHGGRVFNQLLPPLPPQEGIILPPTRAVNETAGRIFVILVDDLHIETSKTPRARAIFEQLEDNLIHEGDLFGIVSTGPSSIQVDMTYDRTMIKSTANRLTGDGFNPNEMAQLSPGPRGVTELSWRAHVAFKTMRDVVSNLEDVQNRRKVVIYFSSGYDFNPFANQRIFARSPLAAAQAERGSGGMDLYAGVPDPVNDPFQRIANQGQVFNDADLALEISELAKAANRANASFYTVDPRGLVTGPDIDYQGPVAEFNEYLFTTQNSLRGLAELTGGKAIVNRNDFDDAFREIDAETSDYYVLGFYSSNSDPTFRTRRLRVEVEERDNLVIQHRSHYTYARASEQVGRPPPP